MRACASAWLTLSVPATRSVSRSWSSPPLIAVMVRVIHWASVRPGSASSRSRIAFAAFSVWPRSCALNVGMVDMLMTPFVGTSTLVAPTYHRMLGGPTLALPRYDRSMNDTEAGRLEYDPPTRLRRLPSWLTSQVARRAERLVSEALAQEDARR